MVIGNWALYIIPVMLFGGVARLLTVPFDKRLCHVGAQNTLVVSFRIYRLGVQREHVDDARERTLIAALVKYNAPLRLAG